MPWLPELGPAPPSLDDCGFSGFLRGRVPRIPNGETGQRGDLEDQMKHGGVPHRKEASHFKLCPSLDLCGLTPSGAAEHGEPTLGALLVLREASLWSLSQEDKDSNREANSAQFR